MSVRDRLARLEKATAADRKTEAALDAEIEARLAAVRAALARHGLALPDVFHRPETPIRFRSARQSLTTNRTWD